MKHTLISFLLIACVCIYAAPAYSEEANPFAFQQSTQTNFSGSSYSSTVYQPFSNTTPAEYSASGMDNGVSGPRKNNSGSFTMDDGFILGPDTPPAQEFPVGEPWVMLVFAALAAGVIAYKRKKSPTLTLPKGKE
ncbi:MAG: hypothetical protein UH084_02750 [Paludibacteraceae bacterium]|nr:hypothetical protein [Paludibacteraceae bacterium]